MFKERHEEYLKRIRVFVDNEPPDREGIHKEIEAICKEVGSQPTLYFLELLGIKYVRENNIHEAEDVILDAMDRLSGWCSPAADLSNRSRRNPGGLHRIQEKAVAGMIESDSLDDSSSLILRHDDNKGVLVVNISNHMISICESDSGVGYRDKICTSTVYITPKELELIYKSVGIFLDK